MRRLLWIATSSLILFTLPLWAQRHGGGGGAHFASGGGFGGHSSAGLASAGRSFAGRSSGPLRSGGLVRSPGANRRIGNHFYHRRAVYGRRSYCPYGIYCPYLGYYGYYDPFYDTEDQDSYADSSTPYRENGEVQRDVQVSSEARNRPQPGPEPATDLVFRDQHVEEVRNYAIADGTLWVLNDSEAGKKIPLADLDLVATAKVNDDRGVDFQVPK